MYTNEQFTVKAGMEIQKEQMKFYETVLKPEYFKKLKEKVEEENLKRKYKTGYDVLRGTSIDNIFYNILN